MVFSLTKTFPTHCCVDTVLDRPSLFRLRFSATNIRSTSLPGHSRMNSFAARFCLPHDEESLPLQPRTLLDGPCLSSPYHYNIFLLSARFGASSSPRSVPRSRSYYSSRFFLGQGVTSHFFSFFSAKWTHGGLSLTLVFSKTLSYGPFKREGILLTLRAAFSPSPKTPFKGYPVCRAPYLPMPTRIILPLSLPSRWGPAPCFTYREEPFSQLSFSPSLPQLHRDVSTTHPPYTTGFQPSLFLIVPSTARTRFPSPDLAAVLVLGHRTLSFWHPKKDMFFFSLVPLACERHAPSF